MRRVDSGYLKRTAESPAVRRIKTQALQSLQLSPANRVLDVGCGPAVDTIEMARLVGPTGAVLGIDGDPAMVDEANRAAIAAGVGAFTRHVIGDAAALSFAANEFDACFSERVLQHLSWADASRAAREMVRVIRLETHAHSREPCPTEQAIPRVTQNYGGLVEPSALLSVRHLSPTLNGNFHSCIRLATHVATCAKKIP